MTERSHPEALFHAFIEADQNLNLELDGEDLDILVAEMEVDGTAEEKKATELKKNPENWKKVWAANKRFKILKFKFKFPIAARTFELFRARSRLYRSQILQVNPRWKALAEIYTMHSFAPFSWDPSLSSIFCLKIAKNIANFCQV